MDKSYDKYARIRGFKYVVNVHNLEIGQIQNGILSYPYVMFLPVYIHYIWIVFIT